MKIKKSVLSRRIAYCLAGFMAVNTVVHLYILWATWEQSTNLLLTYLAAWFSCTTIPWHIWMGLRTSRNWAYDERRTWEDHRIREGAPGDWSRCDGCWRELPVLALQVREGRLECARCSPEAKAAERGNFAKPKITK